MSKEKLSTSEITELISTQAKISKKNADEFLKLLFETIEDELVAGNPVKIKGLGTFKIQWNEPRKSVNVQTGEEITISGYNKVVFTPESSLKDIINEPFAHLEPIELDSIGNDVPSVKETEELPDPLRIFNEQANEIKDILSEIQAMNDSENNLSNELTISGTTNQPETTISESIEYDPEIIEPEFYLVETPEDAEIITSHSESNSTIENTEKSQLTTTAITHDRTEVPTPAEVNKVTGAKLKKQKKKKSKTGWFVLLFIIIAIGSTTAYMYYYPPAFCWCKYKIFTTENIDKVKEKTQQAKNWIVTQEEKIFGKSSKQVNAVSNPDQLIVSDAFSEPDSVNVAEPVDSLALLFSLRRSYTEFLGSERVHSGTRLTYISKRYYGNKDFWVYIYEANKEKIPDPDNLRQGILIRIPKVDKKLIDEKNPKCLDYARELHDLYVKKK